MSPILGPSGSHIGHKETMKDTAACWAVSMTGSKYAALVKKDRLEVLAEIFRIACPVYNGLTGDDFHPTRNARRPDDNAGVHPQTLSDIAVCFMGGRGQQHRCIAHDRLRDLIRLWTSACAARPTAAGLTKHWSHSCRKIRGTTGRTDHPDRKARPEGLRALTLSIPTSWVSDARDADSVWNRPHRLLSPYSGETQGHGAEPQRLCQIQHCLPAFHNERPKSRGRRSKTFGIRTALGGTVRGV